MESTAVSAAQLAQYDQLFNPQKAQDLIQFGLPKDVVNDCVLMVLAQARSQEKYKALDAKKLITDGLMTPKAGVKISAHIETKKSVKYIRVGQLNSDGKIVGIGRIFYVNNCAGTPAAEWELKHISEGQYDIARCGFARYFEERTYWNIGWYQKGLYNGYVHTVDPKGASTGVQNTNTKNEVNA